MRAAALIFRKDLRLLGRAPALLLVLVAYPVLVALLVALALQGDERRPDVAVVNLDTSGRRSSLCNASATSSATSTG